MALARDASSFSGTYNQAASTGLGPAGAGLTLGPFSPPANSLIEVSLGLNTLSGGTTVTINSISNTGTALTWTLLKKQENASGGAAAKWQAWNASGQSSISITITATASAAWGPATPSSGYVVDVWTGAKSDQSTAATPIGGAGSTQNNNFAITTTADSSVITAFGEDWAQTGAPTSSDTMEGTWNIAGQTSGGRATKAVGTAGAQTVNFVTGGASPQLTYIVTEILGALAPVITGQPTDQTANNGATATFTVTATGATSYQWKKNGSNVGTSSSSYALTASYADQGAQITVDCINASGTTTSSAATLRVAYNLTGTGARRRQTFASTPFASTGPLGAPAGGGPITGSISETLSAADTVTASAVFASAVAETAAAVDTITAAAITSAAVAETGSAADSVSAAVTFNSVVAETLAAVDTPSALLVLIAQVNETLTALDTPTASALFNAAVQETLAAADTVTASAVFNASISETLSAVDTTDATISGGGGTTYNDSVSEILSAVDTVSASAIYAGAIVETLATADTTDALLAQLGAIVEILAATETVTGLTAATALVSETGAAADTITALLLSTASVQEVLSVVDTIASQGIFTASIVESMNATDSTDATGGSAPTTSGHAYWLLLKRRTRR